MIDQKVSEASTPILIIGGGPNGLTVAAYLALAGLRVLVLERHTETGGGLTTQEVCGFKLNHHATYMLLGDLMPPVKDLRLKDWGVEFITPPWQMAFLFRDRTALCFATDPQKSAQFIAAISPQDGERFLKMWKEFQSLFDEILLPATYFPPLEPLVQMEKFQTSSDLGRRMAQISELTPLEIVDQYGFRNTRVRLAILYILAMFGLELDEPIGFLAPIYLLRVLQSSLLKGGSHYLASVLRKIVEVNGGKVRTATEIRRLLFKGDAVLGVELSDGSTLLSPVVISTLNPVQNFLELIPGEEVPPQLGGIQEAVRGWQWEPISLFIAHRGAYGPPIRYPGYPEVVKECLNVVMGYEREEDLLQHLEKVRQGAFLPAGHGSVLSLFDPLLIPRHVPYYPHHLLRFECFASYEGDWSSPMKKQRLKECFALWGEYTPELAQLGTIVEVAWSPQDIEKHNPSMRFGSIKHGAYTTLQMGYNRPVPECSSYRTPLRGFYVAGASTHPGGMVILGPGYNCARVVCEDLGIPWRWETPTHILRAQKQGYL